MSCKALNRSRPLYRGSGKFKDGNIPKKSSRRSKAAQKPTSNKYEESFSPDFCGKDTSTATSINGEEFNELVNTSIQDSFVVSGDIAVGQVVGEENSLQAEETYSVEELFDEPEPVEEQVIRKELEHLQKRIASIQESIQLSQSSLCSPSRWESNCLNAVRNCVNEWRNIVTHHGMEWIVPVDEEDAEIADGEEEQIHSDDCNLRNGDKGRKMVKNDMRHMDPESEWSKSCALKTFGLMQLSLQCGPLKGSNPAYFKRCGSDVAKKAHDFLSCIVTREGRSDFQNLRFTEKQCLVVRKWMKDAEKAIVLNRPPSKSATKLQHTSNVTKPSRKKKKKQSINANTPRAKGAFKK